MQKSNPSLLYLNVLSSAYADWLIHLYTSPAKLLDVSRKFHCSFSEFLNYSINVYHNQKYLPCFPVDPSDHRFQDKLWSLQYPFNLYSQLFLSIENLFNDLSSNVPGVLHHHEHLVNFSGRQLLDMLAPSNFPMTNPEVIKASVEQSGMNFVNGYLNLMEDVVHNIRHQPPVGTECYQLGVNLAITPGKVIYRNQLMELIQYTSTTTKVYPQPILIISAWIMKYYILDLSPTNSMVKYLVDKGHTVFIISWKNPDAQDHNLTLEDYINLGIMDALKVVNDIIPNQKVHSVGYCIGGTLLMIAMALMSSEAKNKIESITLLAAQVDFKDAGELRLFIDKDQLEALDASMQEQGYLSGEQMARCFDMLHAKDLIWSRYIKSYLLGKRYPLSDMMAWNADTTRMPYKMHSEYLHKLYLKNELAQGKFKIRGHALLLKDINTPIIAISTLKDHVAPWESVYKIHDLTNSKVTFILTGGGHNSGIISEPGIHNRSYQILEHELTDAPLTPEAWQEQAHHVDGSWWLAWEKWLTDFAINKITPPKLGSNQYQILYDAPGCYVLQQ